MSFLTICPMPSSTVQHSATTLAQRSRLAIGRHMLSGLLMSAMWAVTCSAAAAATPEEVTDNVHAIMPDLTISDMVETAVPGLYEFVSDGDVYYVSEDGRYLFDGSMIDLQTRQNLTDTRKSGIQMALLAEMDESDMLIYEPEAAEDATKPVRHLTVFTDTTCPYCSRLHEEIGELTDANIRVRYLLFPRAGIGSPAHQELESVWCADDPNEAMTVVKAGGKVPEKSCDNPIESHVSLANKVGLRGTPMIFLDSGEVIPGYQPAAALIEMIENSEPL